MVTNEKVNQKEANRNESTQKQEHEKEKRNSTDHSCYTHIHFYILLYRACNTVETKTPNKLRLFARPMEVHPHTHKHPSLTSVSRVALNETAMKKKKKKLCDGLF